MRKCIVEWPNNISLFVIVKNFVTRLSDGYDRRIERQLTLREKAVLCDRIVIFDRSEVVGQRR